MSDDLVGSHITESHDLARSYQTMIGNKQASLTRAS